MKLTRWALPVMVGVIAAGCGSSSSSSTSSSSSNADASSTPGSSSGALAGGAFCDKAKSYGQLALAQSQTLASGALNAQSNPQDFKKKITDLYAKLGPLTQDLANSAPDELKGDIQYLAGIIDKLSQAVSASSGDFTSLSQQFAPLVSDPKFAAATQHLTTYLASACGLTIPTAGAAPSVAIPSFAVPTP